MTDNLEEKIRDLINSSPRFFSNLISDNGKWNYLCSSLDVLDDTEQAIWEFNKAELEAGYIAIYGLLQALFLQQDAAKFIADGLNVSLPKCPELSKIRNLRNEAIGHPMNKGNHKSYHFISRATISKNGFTMMTHDNKSGKDSFTDINLKEILKLQKINVNKQLEAIYDHMKDIENNHRKEHQEEKLVELFHPSLNYLFQKIYESFHSIRRVPQARAHIPMIREMVNDFQGKLEERGELKSNYYVEDLLKKFNYSVDKLEAFFNEDERKIDSIDAEIYCEYAEARINELKKSAHDIDEEYEKEIS